MFSWDPKSRPFIVFSIFIPSARRTLFFQKKIKLLNVEFMLTIVSAQREDNLALVVVAFPTILNTTERPVGMDNTTKQAAASKQVETQPSIYAPVALPQREGNGSVDRTLGTRLVETYFKFILLLCCGDIALLRRFCLEIRYNL